MSRPLRPASGIAGFGLRGSGGPVVGRLLRLLLMLRLLPLRVGLLISRRGGRIAVRRGLRLRGSVRLCVRCRRRLL